MTPVICRIQVVTANKLLAEKKVRGSISMVDRAANMVYFWPDSVSFDEKNVISIPLDYQLIKDEESKYPEDWLLHFAIYKRFSKAVSVACIHPTYGSSYANSGKDVNVYEELYASVFPGGIPCIRADRTNIHGRLDEDSIDRALLNMTNSSWGDKEGALLVFQKGMLVWDITPQNAYNRSLVAEKCAKASFLANQVGGAEKMLPELASYYYKRRIRDEEKPSQGIPGTPVTLKEQKKINLELLLYFDKMCRANGVHYSITGGTLLGAIRHGGFIPWDDDVDVFMTRSEYAKLENVFRNGGRYKFLNRNIDPDFNYVFGRLIDTKTIITESPNTLSAGLGLFLDICVVDGLPKSAFFRKMHMNYMRFLFRCRRATIHNPNSAAYKNKGFAVLLAKKIICSFTDYEFWNKRIEKVMSRYPFDNCEYVGNFTSQYGKREMMHRSSFDSYIDVDFEGHKVMACQGYDEYLTNIYHKYTNLPAIKKRTGHHPGKTYWV